MAEMPETPWWQNLLSIGVPLLAGVASAATPGLARGVHGATGTLTTLANFRALEQQREREEAQQRGLLRLSAAIPQILDEPIGTRTELPDVERAEFDLGTEKPIRLREALNPVQTKLVESLALTGGQGAIPALTMLSGLLTPKEFELGEGQKRFRVPFASGTPEVVAEGAPKRERASNADLALRAAQGDADAIRALQLLSPKDRQTTQVDLAERAAQGDAVASKALELLKPPPAPKPEPTLVERLAAAERKLRENPNDPEATASYDQLSRAFEHEVRLSRERGAAAADVRLQTPERPSAAERTQLAELDSKIAAIDTLLQGVRNKENRAALGSVFENPVAASKRFAGQTLGLSKVPVTGAETLSPEQRIFLAQTAEFTSELRRFLVGAAQTIPEIKNLIPLIPQETDPPEGFEAKLTAIYQGLTRTRGAFERAMKGANVIVPPPPASSAPAPPAPQPRTAPDTNARLNKVNPIGRRFVTGELSRAEAKRDLVRNGGLTAEQAEGFLDSITPKGGR